MKFTKSPLVLILLFSMTAHATEYLERNLLSGKYSAAQVDSLILPLTAFHPYPTAAEREAWQSFPGAVQESILQHAEPLLGCDWPISTATLLLNYTRNGNRSQQEAVHFDRRKQLVKLVLAECVENQDRFMDDIANGVWAICEESFWGVPAHIGGLPDVTGPVVDLFAAETGALLAWTHYLLSDKLDTVSPRINERITYEIQQRIITPCLQRDDFWWMGLSRTRIVNNWNPWICSNWLTCVLLVEDNPARRTASVHKIMRCLDEFMNPYPADGGCDEGPSYWGHAGATLYLCLDLLHSASDGQINIYNEPLVRNIGDYIHRVYIDHDYYVNFADASAINRRDGYMCWNFGNAINSKALTDFGAFLYHKAKQDGRTPVFDGKDLGRTLGALFVLPELDAATTDFTPAQEFWFPQLQVVVARENTNGKGLYLAGKGGHNDESHNHNDVGNFIVYADGYPAIIDVGVETYTSKTFSDRRYEIWTMQSAYHNLPTINGVMQAPGPEYHANDLEYAETPGSIQLQLDLAGAYPTKAGVKSWQRTLKLERGKQISITDVYQLAKATTPLQWTLMSWAEPTVENDGVLRLKLSDRTHGAARDVTVAYDNNAFNVSIEPIAIDDARLNKVWKDKVYRIVFTATKLNTKGETRMVVRQ